MYNQSFVTGKRKLSRLSEKVFGKMTSDEKTQLIPIIYPNVDILRDVIYSDDGDIFNLIEFLRIRDEIATKSQKKLELRIVKVNFENNIFIKKLTYDGTNIFIASTDCGGIQGYHDVYIYTGNAIVKEKAHGKVTYFLVTESINRFTGITHLEGKRHAILSFRVCLPDVMQSHL
ncbi:hypothetical protein [Vallitalea okinawensis]|uniref:hypothetical protein n=1 Tax=Vallitalea okinawensis TaxID=2078660 RepID=UPI000CFDE971|nr:hypothetical protein [Vallitalea okinawensis]